jgi:glycosyltransferase involved in cell wall biosynthesis
MIAPLGLSRAIRQTRPDVVHLHSGAWFKPAWAARLAGVPRVIYTEHGRIHDDPPIARWLDRRAARLTEVVVAVADQLRGYLEREVGIPAGKLVTIPNGIDTRRFTPGPAPAPLRRDLGIPADAWVIGSVGRLEWVKRYDRLVEVVAGVRTSADGRPLYLVLCGDGSEGEKLRALAAARGVADRVKFPGWVTPAEYYRLFDIFALTSLSEGASVSLLEAMASGAVPAVMDVGANAFILGPDLATQVVAAGDVEAFKRLVSETLAAPERRARLGNVARERVVQRFDFEAFTEAYTRLYLAGLNGRPRG